MQTFYNILLVLDLVAATAFALLVFATGKGDAMSGGGGVRTSYKGKASIDDMISRLTLSFGGVFMLLTLALDVLGNRIFK